MWGKMPVNPRKWRPRKGVAIADHNAIANLLHIVNLMRVMFLVRQDPLGKKGKHANPDTLAFVASTPTCSLERFPPFTLSLYECLKSFFSKHACSKCTDPLPTNRERTNGDLKRVI